MGTHLNCINKLMQFKWVPTTYAFINKQTKSTPAAIKTMELLDCALIGVCVVNRSNMVTVMKIFKVLLFGAALEEKSLLLREPNFFLYK